MARMDLRVRVLGRLLGRMSIASMDDERLRTAQSRSVPHDPVTDLLLGGVARGVRLTDGTARGEVGPVPVRTYRPEGASGPLPLVVNFHGGGWTLGDLDSADWLCSNVAATVGAVVVSVDYRLDPGTAGRPRRRTVTARWPTSWRGRRSSAPTAAGSR